MNWSDIPSSETLIQLIQQQLELILPSVNGYSLVTLGDLAAEFSYNSASVANIICITDNETANICAHAHQLPLASDDIDAIFVPLLLEQSKFPHQMLREVARSLRPGGKLILISFNPYSIWGAYKLIFSRTSRIPWKLPFYSLRRLSDWMSLLGLEVAVEHGLFARLPGATTQLPIDRISSIEYSRFGAINFIVAEKKIKTLTAIRPGWKSSRVLHQPAAQQKMAHNKLVLATTKPFIKR